MKKEKTNNLLFENINLINFVMPLQNTYILTELQKWIFPQKDHSDEYLNLYITFQKNNYKRIK